MKTCGSSSMGSRRPSSCARRRFAFKAPSHLVQHDHAGSGGTRYFPAGARRSTAGAPNVVATCLHRNPGGARGLNIPSPRRSITETENACEIVLGPLFISRLGDAVALELIENPSAFHRLKACVPRHSVSVHSRKRRCRKRLIGVPRELAIHAVLQQPLLFHRTILQPITNVTHVLRERGGQIKAPAIPDMNARKEPCTRTASRLSTCSAACCPSPRHHGTHR